MSKRNETSYPGVFYREAQRLGGRGTEKVYYIVFKKSGKVYEEKVGRQFADNMTPARAAGIRAERIEGKRKSPKEIRVEEEAKKQAAKGRYTLNRLWEEYVINTPELRGGKIDKGRFLKYIKPMFGDKEPQELSPFEMDRFRVMLLKGKWKNPENNKIEPSKSPETVKHILELLRRIVNYGVKKRLCQGLNFKIEMPRVDNCKTEDLTPEQLSNLLKAIEEDPNQAAGNMMLMALYSGMRRGEMFNLKWEDIDFERGFIHIRDPKGGRDQTIPLNDATRELLQNHPRTAGPYVFPGRGGAKRTDIRHQVNRIKERAGLPKDFRALHGLRHTYASMLASSGQVDMYTLQKLLTHKSPLMTQRYAHLRDEALRKASNLAGDLIEQALKTDNKELKIINAHKE
ncbi:MAG: tyrosine-type recombinase/integrase [bacterium]